VPAVRDFVFGSGVARLAGELLEAQRVRFYFDHLLVKEPHTPNPTPWHQDIPYWPFLGRQIASVWVSATDLTVEESSLEFLRGSHRWDKYFTPKAFTASGSKWAEANAGDELPDIEAARGDYDVIGFDVKAGDALVFSAWTVHGSPGNAGQRRRVALSTRWLGDDATWDPRPAADPSVTQADTTAVPGRYPDDDDRFPVVWQRGA
jgi:ectoine hydroxylase-related dioxygenase (phytanoyl-CoA dioxygenase family)